MTKILKAIVYQNALDAPVLYENKNTLEETLTTSREAEGVFRLTSPNPIFTENKTHVYLSMQHSETDLSSQMCYGSRIDDYNIGIIGWSPGQSKPVDQLNYLSLTIEIYE